MKLLLKLILILMPAYIFSQNSFIKTFEGIDPGGIDFSVDKDQIYLLHPSPENLIKISKLDRNGNFESGYEITANFPEGVSGDRKFISAKNNKVLVAFRNGNAIFDSLGFSGLVLFDTKKKTSWASKTSDGFAFRTLANISSDGSIYSGSNSVNFLNFPFDYELPLGIVKFEADDGTFIWNYKYYNKNQRNWQLITLYTINSIYNQPIFTCHSSLSDSLGDDRTGSAIVSLSKGGDLLNSAHIQFSIDSLLFETTSFSGDSLGNIYIPARVTSKNFPNGREGAILKFNKNLDLIWAKRLSAENFEYRGLDLTAFENGEVIFAYHTDGDLPIVSGKINPQGQLLWTKGHSFYRPQIEVSTDSSIYFLSGKQYFQDGSWESRAMISKTNKDGLIEGCDHFDACVTLHDIDLTIERWEWERENGPPLEPLSFEIDSFHNSMVDHCGNPPLPTPYFVTPDTICLNQFLEPDSLSNKFAHTVEWTITGNNLLFETKENSFQYYFDNPGIYQIEQEIWLLGCSEFLTREVVVLPDSLGDLFTDNQIVCDSSITLIPNAIRPLQKFRWDDGSVDPTLKISDSGSYAVTVSDGFCWTTDEVYITFFDEKYLENTLTLPSDSSICEELLPLKIEPESDYTNQFFIDEIPESSSFFEINRSGSYQISTIIEGCEISKEFNLALAPCEIDIFIPSSFSPNNDGLNDIIQPLGNDFLGRKMQVFDRWGGLLFETKEAPFAWDGIKAEEGVYVLTFSYLNLKNQKEEIVSTDVLVLR